MIARAPLVAVATEPVPAPLEAFELSDVDVRPEILRRVEAESPILADSREQADVVVVRVLVSPGGRAADARLLRRSKVDAAFDAAALAAVRQWTFSPARRRDRAVACWLNVGVPLRSQRGLGSR
jgi:protein TonB